MVYASTLMKFSSISTHGESPIEDVITIATSLEHGKICIIGEWRQIGG